jgi:hypothetical protein
MLTRAVLNNCPFKNYSSLLHQPFPFRSINMGFPTGPQQSYSNPSGIPGLGGFATTSSDTKSLPNKLGKASSPEPGEIMDATHVHEARMIAMEAKVEKIEKDNDGLRQLVAYLCKGVANLSDNVPNVAQPGTSPSDAAVKKIASDMTAAVLDGVDKSMPKNPETPMSDQVMEDTTGGAENGQSSITVQYLTKSQEKVTKEFLAIQKRLTNLETSFEYHRKSIAKDRRESHDAHDLQKKTSDQIEREIKDFKCTLAFIIEDNDHARRSDLHQRIKITMQMRVFKEQCTHLWEKLVLVAALTGNSSAVKQVIDVQKDLQVCLPKSCIFRCPPVLSNF